MIKPYTYLLINEAHWYIGVRCANRVPASKDVEYMSSSKYIKARIANGEVFTKHIIGEYETREEASAAEVKLIRECWDIPGRVNQTTNGFDYDMSDFRRAKISASLLGKKRPEHVKKKIRETSKITQNTLKAQAWKSYPSSDIKKQKISKLNSKSCTIDGVTIYPSRKALVGALGQGKSGVKHPDFRYINISEND